MKHFKRLLVVLSFASIAMLAACNSKKTTKEKDTTKPNTTTKANTTTEDTKKEETTFDNEKALENFVKKVEACNYVISGDDFTTNVYSKDLIWFDYDRYGYNDFVAMSLDNEIFQAYIKQHHSGDDYLKSLTFVKYGSAIEACTEQAFVLNYLTELYGDNLFNVFYSDLDNPGIFVSYSSDLKALVQHLGSYSDMVSSSMEEVYLTLNDENPTEATLKVHVYNAVAYYDFDIIINITFGNAIANELASNWMNNPTMPDNPTKWNENFSYAIDSIFNLYQDEESCQAIPFMECASYALYLDNNAVKYDTVLLRDSHMSEADVNSYISRLQSDFGFAQTTDEDGEVCYRKLLRNKSNCYSQIYVEYNDGLDLMAIPYYDCDKYDSLSEINTILEGNGYAALDSDDDIVSVLGIDEIWLESEAYLYQSEYDLVMIVTLEFSDIDNADMYLDSYIEKLEEIGYEFANSQIDPRYIKFNGMKAVRYALDNANNTLMLKFKSNRIYEKTEIDEITINYPTLVFNEGLEYYSAINLIEHEKILNHKDYSLYFEVNATFDDYESVDEFLDYYVNELIGAGFGRVQGAGTGKTYEYVNDNDDIFGFSISESEVSSEITVRMVFAKETTGYLYI